MKSYGPIFKMSYWLFGRFVRCVVFVTHRPFRLPFGTSYFPNNWYDKRCRWCGKMFRDHVWWNHYLPRGWKWTCNQHESQRRLFKKLGIVPRPARRSGRPLHAMYDEVAEGEK